MALVLIVMVLLVIHSLLTENSPVNSRPATCDEINLLHEWTFNNNHKLQCCRCNMIAGEHHETD